ncbi:hypothetical protein HN011_009797, partial [Eciton burchellii]
ERISDYEIIRKRNPNRVPVIVERYKLENHLPLMNRSKFLVPDFLTVTEFCSIVRRRLELNPTQAVYLLSGCIWWPLVITTILNQIKTKYLLGTYDTLIDIYVEFHGDSRSASNSTCLQLNMQSLCD